MTHPEIQKGDEALTEAVRTAPRATESNGSDPHVGSVPGDRVGFLPNEALVRNVLVLALASADRGCALLLTDDGRRDLLGRTLHLIGVSDIALVDQVKAAPATLIAAGALTIWLQTTNLYSFGQENQALARLQGWAGSRRVGDLRQQLREQGIPLEGPQ